MKVIELYRHPVKSFTPERLDRIEVYGGKVQGDRVLGFRFADQGGPDDWAWRRKINFVALSNTPAMALVDLNYDNESRILTLNYEGEIFAEGSIDSKEDRHELSEALGEYVASLEINPLSGHPERIPLNLIGDGRQGLFHDSEIGGVTIFSRESLAALEASMGASVDGRRFRSNVVIDGAEAWEEISWSGRVSIGEHVYMVEKTIPRCLATHANPVDGERDQDIMKSLIVANGFEIPTFAIRLLPVEDRTEIHVGDTVEVG
jgi:uncharacterized protein YcbX